jgi:N-acetyl sugar amidotransferase
LCGGCQWHDQKQHINWDERKEELKKIIKRNKSHSFYDAICPVSGGKDGTHVALELRKMGYNILCITFMPPIQTPIGRQNLDNFRHEFDHIAITPNAEKYRQYNKDWLLKRGMPKQGFVVGISSSVLQIASALDIRTCVWGENAESEYGGNLKSGILQKFNRDFLIDIYYEGQDDSEKYGHWWKIPTQEQLDKITSTWWSYYEDWEPENHARAANLEMMVGGSIGTFTNYSQLDCILQDLHCYLQFVKFGFGRCTSDASIEIRRGRLSREQGVKVVNELDGQFPVEYLPIYLDYFEMTEKEFWQVIDKHANKDLLVKTGRIERPYVLKEPVR